MKLILFITLFFTTIFSFSQVTISGRVTNTKGNSIEGANIYLEGTYDGASSTENGTFSFSTSEKGIKTLVVSFVSFETFYKTADVSKLQNLTIKLRDDVNTLDTVEINAGSFEAGNKAKVTALKPLDIVTTASAMGDVFGAFQTLPGTSLNEEDGRLFVRGGDADETQIYIDGIHVANPFLATGKNIPTRGRFSPFLFKGMSFSTGGYSAEYGQALSGVLTMNTIDEPTQEKTDLGFMTVGLSAGNTQIWNENSFSINASYTNLAPYQWAFPDRNKWLKPYEGISGEMVFRHKPNEDGLLKLYSSFGVSDLDVIQEHINFSDGFNFAMKNRNLYFNGSYKQRLENSWTIFGGLSYTNNKTNVKLQADNKVESFQNSAHAKIKLRKRFSNRFKLSFGTEYFINKYDEDFLRNPVGNFNSEVNNNLFGSFVEVDIFFNKKFATKIGLRAEHSEALDEFTISPRASIAYKTAKNSQISLAYGQFYQNPKNDILKFNDKVASENAEHYIANYQFSKDQQILRLEGYYKKYNDFIKYDTQFVNPATNFSNNGNGYAKGIDLFWRDGKNIKYLDYWVSYSFLDTKRNYKNYPTKARPNFASEHNLSVVGKYWIDKWRTQVGVAHNFASGRTYTNPNKAGFLNQKTKNYNSTSFNFAYLITQQKILYFSVNNIFGTNNVYGYRYKNKPDVNGIFTSQPITPSADRFFFIGFFWSISDDGKSNQLDNL